MVATFDDRYPTGTISDPDLQDGLQMFAGGALRRNDAELAQPFIGCRVVSGSRSSSPSLQGFLRSEGFARIYEYALLPSAASPRWVIPMGKRSWTLSGL